ncbi:nickel pincer cofactor biosynthesis protein LarB [Desulfurivibrio alkaliphilus]|uniref:1-(5-phosphoribosyl)-5-amino-4-imidazole-carboxylate (AIR) carboxylase n=1 Tax=Desulfurivibrio alkaliphilus (strain DSM 19089 / UNIQEM U267 / AHT2) TaxID=589865 RepID=D6Z0K0_DESAT|nr:nickel pincer cofactor biosynthesis protein LarB [Desulfurivibrio alkaliphilus]ADH85229.1 1-(5-phosphoribosyl)-5-amino-4-imidazole-carboxylate (AIR) carboxylase [Desulfurivibrio alkaliphilus AHT 2]
MEKQDLAQLLAEVAAGRCSVEQAVDALKHWPGEKLGCAHLDHQRRLRTGIPEVVFGEGKSAEQVALIMQRMLAHRETVLATRVDAAKAAAVTDLLPELTYFPAARMLAANLPEINPQRCRGTILVVSAGTSDEPVAEEAALTATALAHPVSRLYDVGVAGIHRLLGQRQVMEEASVLIVVAGMEGALPSVVGGLVSKPVIAVPTSVGYGTGFGGIAALLGMLNSCAPGVTVVNIDNGFGAACAAHAINGRG